MLEDIQETRVELGDVEGLKGRILGYALGEYNREINSFYYINAHHFVVYKKLNEVMRERYISFKNE